MINYIKLGLIAIAIAAVSAVYYIWHVKPINSLTAANASLEEQLTEVGRLYNICEANLSKQQLQGYIDGIGDLDTDEEPDINFDNLTY